MHKFRWFSLLSCVLIFACNSGESQESPMHFFKADNPLIRYTGRIDFNNPGLPRFWQPGVYIEASFTGTRCEVIVNDEVLWGSSHNYLELVVDGKAIRLRTNSKTDTLLAASDLSPGAHTLQIVKNTEANIGWLELVGIRCEALVPLPAQPSRKIEFIGNSITCGTGSDQSTIPCGKGVWQDQHNAYLSYGAITARNLNAQYHLSAVSGIGLMHSCCNMEVVMPQVFDKISMRDNKINWNFSNYQPDVLTICLGQNDGIQDSTVFAKHYIAFLTRLRSYYPNTVFVCLSSPMADEGLRAWMMKIIPGIVAAMQRKGDDKVYKFFFSQRYSSGCDSHPSLAEHRQIADELTAYLKKIMNW